MKVTLLWYSLVSYQGLKKKLDATGRSEKGTDRIIQYAVSQCENYDNCRQCGW